MNTGDRRDSEMVDDLALQDIHRKLGKTWKDGSVGRVSRVGSAHHDNSFVDADDNDGSTWQGRTQWG